MRAKSSTWRKGGRVSLATTKAKRQGVKISLALPASFPREINKTKEAEGKTAKKCRPNSSRASFGSSRRQDSVSSVYFPRRYDTTHPTRLTPSQPQTSGRLSPTPKPRRHPGETPPRLSSPGRGTPAASTPSPRRTGAVNQSTRTTAATLSGEPPCHRHGATAVEEHHQEEVEEEALSGV